MNQITLRTRILVSYLLLIIPAALLLVIYVNQQILASEDEVFFSDFEEDTEIILSEVEEVAGEIGDGEGAWSEALGELGDLADALDMQVQLIAENGNSVFFDTTEGGETEYRLRPPEDVEALIAVDESHDWFDEDSGVVHQPFYVEIDEETTIIVRIGRELSPTKQQQFRRTVALIVGTFGGAAFLVAGMGFWMANALTKPLNQLRTSAQAMAQGNLQTRANTNAPPEVAKLAQDFNEMATAVEAMLTEQKAFAGNAAHELRTPLTAIRLRTETLLEDEPDAELTRRYTEEIDAEARRLSRLVEDLRLLARTDANRVEMGREMVDFGRIIRTLKQEYQAQLLQKELQWQSEIDPALPTVEAGLNHMQMVMRNLLENAVKYTPHGGKIAISAQSDGEQVIITVADNGVGISAEDLPYLFKRFYRADKSHNRAIPGSGLGLGIVKNMLELYGGTIVIESEGIDQGTTAIMTLPLNRESTS